MRSVSETNENGIQSSCQYKPDAQSDPVNIFKQASPSQAGAQDPNLASAFMRSKDTRESEEVSHKYEIIEHHVSCSFIPKASSQMEQKRLKVSIISKHIM